MDLNFPFKKKSSDSSNIKDKLDENHEFLKAINLFTSQRNKLGISLEELSNKTKISRNVLIAIENGKKKYLPEKTYLISMIKSIEINLNLEKGALKGLIVRKDNISRISRFKFNFINIDFLNSWIGSLIYILFMLLSILLLNGQQRYLIKINSVSTEPITLEKAVRKDENMINNQK